ncbi:MAG: hypothetical protein HRU38_07860 [Saccharospirillaceae bacterium]|nr:hypothetical protein [Pseudomonadales bacterium]NRB78569.1 hypothetical protein [Saccharospirillaceae bacterium]
MNQLKASKSESQCDCHLLSNRSIKSKWLNLFQQARANVVTAQWHLAISDYQQALHLTSHMMSNSNNHKTVQNQYVMLLLESAYCFRKQDKHFEKGNFLNMAHQLLSMHINKNDVNIIIKPIMDILYSDINSCDDWINTLFEFEYSSNQTVH